LAISGCWHQGYIRFGCRNCAACADLQLGEVKVENMIHEHGSKLKNFVCKYTLPHTHRWNKKVLGYDLGLGGSDLEPEL
jgi:hypothetical protein